MQNPGTAYISLTAAMVIAGSSVVVGKLMVASFPVFLASGLRFGIAALFLVPLLFWVEGRFPRVSRRDLLILFLQAVSGVFLFSIFLLYGLQYTTATIGSIITSTTPAVTALISVVFLRERLGWNVIAGVLLAMVGILTINSWGTPDTARADAVYIVGSLLVFGAVVGEALFTIFGKIVAPRVSPLAIATFVSVFGLVLFLPFALVEARTFDFAAVAPVEWIPVIYYGIVVTVIGFFLWYQGVAAVPASTAAVFTGVLPVSAVVLSYTLLDEPFLWAHLVGLGCVLGAIAVMTYGSRRHHPEAL
jgi:drug/metabolite transporter (DMT)-like permease